MSLGTNIRAARERALLSCKQFAHDAGITRTWLSQIEHDHRRPSGRILHAIAGALKTTPQALAAKKDHTMADALSHKLRTTAQQLTGKVLAGEFQSPEQRADMTALSILLDEWSTEAESLEEAAREPSTRERESRAFRLFGRRGPNAIESPAP